MKETEWRWNSQERRWELVEVGDVRADQLAAEAAFNTGSLGCVAFGGIVAGMGWLVRRLRRRRT